MRHLSSSPFRFWFLLAAVAVTSTFLALARGYLRQSPYVRNPAEAQAWLAAHPPAVYVAQYEERLSTPSGNKGIGRTVFIGVRADGGRVMKEQFFNANTGMPSHTERHLFLPQGVLVSVWDQLKVYSARHSKLAINPETDGPRLDPDSNCELNLYGQSTLKQAGPEGTLFGFRALHLQLVNPGHSPSIETWRLPGMGCVEARRLATFRDKSGSVTDVSDLVATSISATPPDATLFDIPTDYQSVSPSEATKRLVAFMNAPPISATELLVLQRADANYLKNRIDLSTLQK
jgi:hypothetical protein